MPEYISRISLGCSSFRRSSIPGRRGDILQYTMGKRTICFSINHMNKQILSTAYQQITKDISV